MTYKDFTYPKVLDDLGLALREERLFAGVPPLAVPDWLRAAVTDGVDLTSGMVNEKSRSEFVVAPLLLYLRQATGRGFGLFSGPAFDVDPARGLAGYCDFLLTRDRRQSIIAAPVVAIAEAKNDNTWYGLGQCIAGMVAAREFNARAGGPAGPVFGTSTNGVAWRFLRLDGDVLTHDLTEHPITDPGNILGILKQCVTGP